ncbi:MAG: hypothetical protein ABIK28_20985 [Planctomycetota bacterium]
MQSSNSRNPEPSFSAKTFSGKSTIIGACFLICILFAGVISLDVNRSKNNKPFDPRIERSNIRIPNALDAHYQGYVPQDAVIPTQEGIFVIDDKGHFKKLSPEIK